MVTLPRVFHQVLICLRADPRSLVATSGISFDFFSSGYLDISVLRVRFDNLCIQLKITFKRLGFPIRKSVVITLLCQLTTAYRRLTRPSSPPTAKASTVYAQSLDHITQNILLIINYLSFTLNNITLTNLNFEDIFQSSLDYYSLDIFSQFVLLLY